MILFSYLVIIFLDLCGRYFTTLIKFYSVVTITNVI